MGALLRTGLVACLAAVALTAPAHAAFPGANGKIAFYRFGDIYTVNPDGTGTTNVTNDPGRRADYGGISWSPDGRRIAFVRLLGTNDDVFVMNADGTGLTRLTTCSYVSAIRPDWSPDGSRIVYQNGCGTGDGTGSSWDIYVMNPDGTGQVDLTPHRAYDASPAWSPDGSKIAFISSRNNGLDQIYTMNPDGSDVVRITDPLLQDGAPEWSPDGSRIASVSGDGDLYTMRPDGTDRTKLNVSQTLQIVSAPSWSPDGQKIVFGACVQPPPGQYCGGSDLYTVNRDGSQLTQITHTGDFGTPDWQPIPQGYARPKGATPIRASLVVAFKQCTNPNSNHGAPLSYASCTPPVQTSDFATVGTAPQDPVASLGSVRENVIPGNPATPANEADVAVQISITDVRNKSDLSDYTGELRADASLRLTDRYNSPNPGGPGPGTVSDTSFPITAPCAATADTSVGSTCSVATTTNTLAPNAVVEGRRAMWQLGQVQVYDGGSDGVAATTGDNTLFMDQGVFIP